MEEVNLGARLDGRTLLAFSVTVVCFASAFAGIRAELEAYTPEHVALLRYVTASAVLALYAAVVRLPLPAVRDLPAISALGLIGFSAYNLLLNHGEVSVEAGTASFLVATVPVFMALFGGAFLGERVGPAGWAGIAVGLAGVGVISFGTGEGLDLNPRALVVLAAALAQACYFVGQKPLLRRYGAMRLTAYAVWAGTLFLFVFSGGLLGEIQAAPPGATLAVVYMGIFPGAVAYATYAYGLSRTPASVASTFLYLVPVVAVGIAWIWLGEVPTATSLVGGLLALIGVVLVNTRRREKTGKEKTAKESP